jgi:hypothetical protein
MSLPDQYPPPPQQEDFGRSRSGGGIGCISIGALSILFLFASVVGLCVGKSVGVGLVFFWLAVATFGIAVILGLFSLIGYFMRR